MLRKILLVVAILVTSQTVSSQEIVEPFETVEECAQSCIEVLQLADDVMLEQQSVIQFQGAQINNQLELLAELQQEIDRKGKWYYDPVVIGLLGLLSGMIIAK